MGGSRVLGFDMMLIIQYRHAGFAEDGYRCGMLSQ
jgi:hypothetical protein